MAKISTGLRLTQEAIELRRGIAKELGLDQTAVIEFLIRDYAKKNNIKPIKSK